MFEFIDSFVLTIVKDHYIFLVLLHFCVLCYMTLSARLLCVQVQTELTLKSNLLSTNNLNGILQIESSIRFHFFQ